MKDSLDCASRLEMFCLKYLNRRMTKETSTPHPWITVVENLSSFGKLQLGGPILCPSIEFRPGSSSIGKGCLSYGRFRLGETITKCNRGSVTFLVRIVVECDSQAQIWQRKLDCGMYNMLEKGQIIINQLGSLSNHWHHSRVP